MYSSPKEYGIQSRVAENPAPTRRLLRPYEWKDRIIVMQEKKWTPVSLFAVPTYYSVPSTRKMILPEELEDNADQRQNPSFLCKVFDAISSVTLLGQWFKEKFEETPPKEQIQDIV